MEGRQGADLVELLKPPVTVPVHYDDYDRFASPLGDFVREVAARRVPGESRPGVGGGAVRARARRAGGPPRPRRPAARAAGRLRPGGAPAPRPRRDPPGDARRDDLPAGLAG